MSQRGYTNCSCCGRVYKDDGSEDWLWRSDHGEEPCLVEAGIAPLWECSCPECVRLEAELDDA